MKFPELLHVSIESPRNEEPYFVVHDDGVQDFDVDGERVAIYKLVKVGKVEVSRRFVASK